jgi:hypothetical protein
VDPMAPGSSAFYDALQVIWIELRHVLEVVVWGLLVGLAGAAGCWCCGYAARAAWLRAGPPLPRPRRRRKPATTEEEVEAVLDLVLVEEAERGIEAIEVYLASVSAGGPDTPPSGRAHGSSDGGPTP